MRRAGSSPTYGEITPTAVARLVESLDPGPDDVFYDLGSGLGKVVLQVAMTRRLARCVGLELAPARHRVAVEVLGQAREEGLLRTEDVRLREQDILRARMPDATLVYCCSTAFPDPFMMAIARKLARREEGLRLATLLDLDENPWFSLEQVLRLDMTWRRRSKVHVYRLTRRRR